MKKLRAHNSKILDKIVSTYASGNFRYAPGAKANCSVKILDYTLKYAVYVEYNISTKKFVFGKVQDFPDTPMGKPKAVGKIAMLNWLDKYKIKLKYLCITE